MRVPWSLYMDATRILVCHLTCCGLEGEKIITENQAKENLTNVGWTYFLIELLPTSFLLFLNFSIDRKYNLSMAKPYWNTHLIYHMQILRVIMQNVSIIQLLLFYSAHPLPTTDVAQTSASCLRSLAHDLITGGTKSIPHKIVNSFFYLSEWLTILHNYRRFSECLSLDHTFSECLCFFSPNFHLMADFPLVNPIFWMPCPGSSQDS